MTTPLPTPRLAPVTNAVCLFMRKYSGHNCQAAKSLVKSNYGEAGSLGERRQVGVCPQLGGWLRLGAETLEQVLELRLLRLSVEFHALIFVPLVVGRPSTALIPDIHAHHLLVGEQPQQTDLREPAEEHLLLGGFQPVSGDDVMHVAFMGRSQPHVDVREKERSHRSAHWSVAKPPAPSSAESGAG